MIDDIRLLIPGRSLQAILPPPAVELITFCFPRRKAVGVTLLKLNFSDQVGFAEAVIENEILFRKLDQIALVHGNSARFFGRLDRPHLLPVPE
jgi:hypothetical protein